MALLLEYSSRRPIGSASVSDRSGQGFQEIRLEAGQVGRQRNRAPIVNVIYRGGGTLVLERERGMRSRAALAAGSVVLKPANEKLTCEAGPRGMAVLALVVGDELRDDLASAGHLLGESVLTRSPHATALAHQAATELRRPDTVSSWQLRGLSHQIVTLVLRARDSAAGGAPAWWLDDLETRLREGFRKNPRVAELACRYGVATRELSETFRHEHRRSIGDFLRELRVEHAMRLLRETRMPLAEVALDSGFYDQSHMTNLLKRHTGMTPAVFRRAATGGRARGPSNTNRPALGLLRV